MEKRRIIKTLARQIQAMLSATISVYSKEKKSDCSRKSHKFFRKYLYRHRMGLYGLFDCASQILRVPEKKSRKQYSNQFKNSVLPNLRKFFQ